MTTYYKIQKPFHSFLLKVDKINHIYVREYGNKKGIPLFYIHGGPGGAKKDNSITKYIDLHKFHLILIDQRGTGKSTPNLSLYNNIDFLIQDIETVESIYRCQDFLAGCSW